MAHKIKINNKYIGDDEPVYLIAEIGINHNGDMQIAKKLMDATWATGWDCVKFQKRTPDLCVPEGQKNLIRETPWGKMTYLEYRHKIEFQKEEYDYINKYCGEKPLDWTASVWDIPSVDFLLQYDIPFIKIPSAKLTDLELIEKCAKSGKPVFLSTGMSTLQEIDNAVTILEKHLGKNYVLFRYKFCLEKILNHIFGIVCFLGFCNSLCRNQSLLLRSSACLKIASRSYRIQ